MLAAEHLHTHGLLVVLLTTALAVAALRVAVHFLQRAREAQDRSLLARHASDRQEAGMRAAPKAVAERDTYEQRESSP